MDYLMIFLVFWFVGCCFTLMSGYKRTIVMVLDIFSVNPLAIYIFTIWPIFLLWAYEDGQQDESRRKMHDDFDKEMVDRMFINMGMEKIDDPNTRFPNRV